MKLDGSKVLVIGGGGFIGSHARSAGERASARADAAMNRRYDGSRKCMMN